MTRKNFYAGDFEIDNLSDELVITTQPTIIINDDILVDIDDNKEFTIVSKNGKIVSKKQAKEILQLYNILIYSAEEQIMQEYLKEYQSYMSYNYNTSHKSMRVADYNYIAELGTHEHITIHCNPISDMFIIQYLICKGETNNGD